MSRHRQEMPPTADDGSRARANGRGRHLSVAPVAAGVDAEHRAENLPADLDEAAARAVARAMQEGEAFFDGADDPRERLARMSGFYLDADGHARTRHGALRAAPDDGESPAPPEDSDER